MSRGDVATDAGSVVPPPRGIHGDTLVVVVTPDARLRAELVDRVAGLAPVLTVADTAGAAEVLRPRAPEPPATTLPAGLVLDTREHRISYRGAPLTLSQHEHELFVLMASDVGRAWTYDELHREVWGSAFLASATDLHSTIKRLRRKLGCGGVPLAIETVRGVGFRLIPAAPTPAAPTPAARRPEPTG